VLVSGARDPLAEALQALPEDTRLLLAVDQLEEVFTACRSEGERAAFADTLARAAADPDGRAVVVVALRADFYGRFAMYPGLAEHLGANQVLVGPMQPSELRRAVELPAGRVGLRVERELTDALVDDVEGEPGALPLLSTALLELWQKQHDSTLTVAAYRESGGVHGAVARLAEGTYGRISDDRKPLVRALLLRLVGEDEGEAPVRRRAPLAELDLERNDDVAAVLATLADNRLVSVGEGSVEVAHEALLREWPRLGEWIEEDAEGRRLRRHITRAAGEWDAGGRDQSELYRGARLAAALDWSSEHAFELNELEREFVTKSREVSEREAKRARRTNRRLRVLLAGVALLLAASLIGGIYAVVQRGDARDAETAQLAQRLGAQALVEEALDRSLLLARQAVAIDDTPQTRGYLLSALLRAPSAMGIMHGGPDAGYGGLGLSPDGKTLAVADFYNGLRFFDAGTYEQVGGPLDVPEWLESLAYSPDGKTIAFGGAPFVRLIDARTRKRLAEAQLLGRAARMAFTKDGSMLVVFTAAPETITVRDAATLRQIGAVRFPEGFRGNSLRSFYRPPHLALTPDSRSLITASDAGELAWWDLRTLRKTRTLRIDKGYHALALSADGRTVAVGIDRGLQLVDARTGAVRAARSGFAGSPNWVLFSPDDSTVVSANVDGTVTLWDVASATPRESLRGHSNGAQQPVFAPDGTSLFTASDDGTVVAWDLTGRRGVKRPFTFTHDRDFQAFYDAHPGRLSPDGRLIAVGLRELGVQLWRTSDLTRDGRPLLDTIREVKALAFSPDGRTLAAITDEGDLTLWDVASRSLRRPPIPALAGYLVGIAFSGDGRLIATANSTGVALWNPTTGARLGTMSVDWSSDVALSADGALVASVGVLAGGATVWDTRTHDVVATLEARKDADDLTVALSSDGRLVAVGGYGSGVRIWDVRTRKLIHELPTPGGGALEFSKDGSMLAVAGNAVSLWDVETGIRIGPTLTAGSRRAMMDLSSDGRRLLVTFANGEGAVWDIDPASWARRACAVANRTLTRDEWSKFLPGRPYEPACR
jgi:WD40 repeat protein